MKHDNRSGRDAMRCEPGMECQPVSPSINTGPVRSRTGRTRKIKYKSMKNISSLEKRKKNRRKKKTLLTGAIFGGSNAAFRQPDGAPDEQADWDWTGLGLRTTDYGLRTSIERLN